MLIAHVCINAISCFAMIFTDGAVVTSAVLYVLGLDVISDIG